MPKRTGRMPLRYGMLILFVSLTSLPLWGQDAIALSLDGTDDYVQATVAEIGTGASPYTIEALLYVESLPSYRSWALNLGQYNTGAHHWLLEADGTFVIGQFNGAQIRTTIPLNQWTQIAAVFDGTYLKVYIDGTLVGTTATDFNFTNKNLFVGRPRSGEDYFDGLVDEVRIWQIARTQEQIQRYQNNALVGDQESSYDPYDYREDVDPSCLAADLFGDENGLILYYNFSEGAASGDQVMDQSSNDNNGVIHEGNSASWGTGLSLCHITNTPCDDGNSNTVNDKEDGNCNCIGLPYNTTSFCYSPNPSDPDPYYYQYHLDFDVYGAICTKRLGKTEEVCQLIEVHLSSDRYVACDWYFTTDYGECDDDGIATVRRGRRRFTPRDVWQKMVNYNLDFIETWEVVACEATVLVEVFVYKTDETIFLNTIPLDPGEYVSNAIITSSGSIEAMTEVNFVAGNYIQLLPGFTVEENATFTAEIEPQELLDCSSTDLSTFREGVAATSRNRFATQTDMIDENGMSLLVHPNPIHASASIRYELAKATSVNISLSTLQGQQVEILQVVEKQSAGQHALAFPKQNYPKGIYLLHMQTDTGHLVQKIVIQ